MSRPPLSPKLTSTVSSGLTVAVCACCVGHSSAESPLRWEVVLCPDCGLPCSCEGCVEEVAGGYSPAKPAKLVRATQGYFDPSPWPYVREQPWFKDRSYTEVWVSSDGEHWTMLGMNR